MVAEIRWMAQAQPEKPKKYSSSLDDETIKNIGRYYGVDPKNFEALVKYMKNRGLA